VVNKQPWGDVALGVEVKWGKIRKYLFIYLFIYGSWCDAVIAGHNGCVSFICWCHSQCNRNRDVWNDIWA